METTKVKAILFDTRSIQRYIFASNELKTNIGASYIVEHIFDTVLLSVLQKKLGVENCDVDSWRDGKADFQVLQTNCRVAYIGGGNALVLFKLETEDEVLKGIISEFTKRLLVTYPGLKTGAAIGELDLSSEKAYAESDELLHKKLKQNQNTVFPQVNPAYTGLTLTCDSSGEAANYYLKAGKQSRFVSQEVGAKISKATEATDSLSKRFEGIIGDCRFPTELENLGQKETENYIAIVHIDGNNMGKKFIGCKTLGDRAALSYKVRKKTEAVFAALLEGIVSEYSTYAAYLDLPSKRDTVKYLPVRPLILGGDDITFVCTGRLALILAKRFMEKLMEADPDFGPGIDSCGGVAIMPASYPFFRGYQLAEQLCDAAKKKSRKKEGTSWLDFAILHGEQAPTLEQIRQQEYSGVLGNLHFGPYQVGSKDEHFSLDKLLECADGFQTIPNNKIKEMRDVIQRGKHDIQKFMEQLKHNGQHLPHIAKWDVYEEQLWDKDKTPYIDAIEIMDFLPKEAK